MIMAGKLLSQKTHLIKLNGIKMKFKINRQRVLISLFLLITINDFFFWCGLNVSSHTQGMSFYNALSSLAESHFNV